MSFNVNFLRGSDADKDFMTCHLVTGIVARRVVDNVLDASHHVNEECRSILKNLWINNLSIIGGLPVEQEQVQLDLQSIRGSRRLTEPLPPIAEKGRMKKPAVFMQRPALSVKPSESITGIRESYIINSSNALNAVVDTTNMTETAVPIAAACTSSLSVRNHQKCSQKELTALLHTARYGTKVEVRVREKVSRTNADGSSDSVQNNLSGTARSTTQEQADPDTCFRWKVGRISQVSPDIVSVRFPNGADVRVPWIRRDVKLFRHSPSYQPQYSQDSDRSYEEHSISHNSASTINDSDNLNWNSNSNRSSSRVEPESSSSAAADFLLQNYDSDSDDDRYNDGGEGSERERAVDTLSAAFEHGDFSEYTDRDGEEVERGLELCGAGGTEGRSGGHEGLLGLENLLMQYQGERGNEEEDRGCEFLGNTVQGFESGSSGISSDQGPSKKRILSFASSSAAGSGDVNSSNIEYVSGEHDATADVAKAREENDRYEALCRLQDEDAYFARLNLHSKNGTTKIFQGPYSFDYAEQKGEIKKRKRLSFLGASNTDDQGHEEGEGEVINPLSVGGQVNVPLGPEEDPTHPIPPPDVCVYGRLGKFTKGNLKCSNWEFYLRDVYIHFMEDGGKDLALPRCMLRMGTKHFVAPSDSTSATDPRSKSRDFVSTIATRREERRKRRENIPSLIAL